MNNDCIYEINELSGGIGSHNGRCPRGLESPEVHLAPTYHVRLEHWCGRVCLQCSRDLGKRAGAIVRELTPSELEAAA